MDEAYYNPAQINRDPKFLKPVWYLPGPFYRYAQDVKALARRSGLRIIDANVTSDRSFAAAEVPEVTLRPEYASTSAETTVNSSSTSSARRGGARS